ncbi:MAG TPA: hypothetical protein VK564_00350, partial [Thermodesulfobacteriota bacterium]|nr:hypothetical protein [Thermodesulfobacteriota bacterium]
VAAGEFRPDLNPNLVRSVILGTIEHMLYRRILLGKPENLVEFTDSLTDLIVNGIASERSEKVWNLQIRLEPEAKGGARPMESSKDIKPVKKGKTAS